MSIQQGEPLPSSEDTTRLQLEAALEQANALLRQVEEEIQNPLANAKRRMDAGREIDTGSVLERVRSAVLETERQAQQFPGRQIRMSPFTEVSARELIDAYWVSIAKRQQMIATGFHRLNTMLGGGFEPQRLMILLGAPGGGKTTFANQLAERISATRPVLYVTSEDAPHALLCKTLARLGQMSYHTVLRGGESDRARITEVLASYREGPSAERLRYLDASQGMDSALIRERAQAHFEQFREASGQGVLIVDYLQRLARAHPAFRSGSGDLRHIVTIFTEQLRSLANDLNCCVLALASQNRASGYGANNTSMLATAKESGDIEFSADVIMALVADSQRVPPATWLKSKILRIDKNRQGEEGMIALDWYGERQQFTEAEIDQAAWAVSQEEAAASSNGRRAR